MFITPKFHPLDALITIIPYTLFHLFHPIIACVNPFIFQNSKSKTNKKERKSDKRS